MVSTTIKIKPTTKNNLDLFREYKNESYDEVISKLVYIVNNIEKKPELGKDIIKQIESARNRIKSGKFVSHEDAKKRLGLKI